MKIIIVGCGKVGEKLTAVLSQEHNEITVIDKSERVVDDLCSRYDVMGVVGNGASYGTQQEADIQHTDLLIAVTGSDELNLLCAVTARIAGKCRTICRLRNPEYSKEARDLKEQLGLAMVVNQEYITAQEIASVLKFPSAIEISTFAKGRVELLRFKVPEKSLLDGISLMEMQKKIKSGVLVCTVERGANITIPRGDFVLQSGDVISIVSDKVAEEKFFKQVGIQTNRIKDAMIIGGGDTAYYLTKMLAGSGIKVKIIEKQLQRCEVLSERLPHVDIINGDGTDEALLMEEGLDSTQAVIALTNMDEENIILSLYAKGTGVRKTITKINRINFEEVIRSLDLDTLVHPKMLMAERILQYVRAKNNSIGSNVETLHWIVDDRAEALEFVVRKECRYKDIPLKDLPLRKDVLIACITRKSEIILPSGNDMLKENDSVIVVTTTPGLHDISNIMKN